MEILLKLILTNGEYWANLLNGVIEVMSSFSQTFWDSRTERGSHTSPGLDRDVCIPSTALPLLTNTTDIMKTIAITYAK